MLELILSHLVVLSAVLASAVGIYYTFIHEAVKDGEDGESEDSLSYGNVSSDDSEQTLEEILEELRRMNFQLDLMEAAVTRA